MRFLTFLLIFPTYLSAAEESAAGKLWTELKAKREALAGFHQEFEVSRTTKLAGGDSQANKRKIVLDVSKTQWRESTISGSGEYIRIFDGQDVVSLDQGGDEYVR